MKRLALGIAAVIVLAVLLAVARLSAPANGGTHTRDRSRDVVDLYLSPNGNDFALCGRRDPCRTMNRAYQAAAPGEVVQMAGGTYGSQTLESADRPPGKPVVFRPAPDAHVRTGDVRINGAAGIEFRDIGMASYYIAGGSSDLTFRDVRAEFFFIRSASRVSILGGSIGGVSTAIAATIGSTYESTVPSRAILIDGVTFHDMTRADNPAGHTECLFIQSVDGLVLRNSRFDRCDVFDVYANNIGIGPQLRNILIENSFFGRPTDTVDPAVGGWYSLYVSYSPGEPPIRNLIIRNNSFAKGFHLDPGGYVASGVIANVSSFLQPQCIGGIAWSYNVFDHARCGSTDRRAPLGFVDAAAGDLHLRPGAAAIGADHGPHPATDIDGDPRPQGAPADSGADEWTPGGAG